MKYIAPGARLRMGLWKKDKIWSIIEDDLPGLKTMIDGMLSEEF